MNEPVAPHKTAAGPNGSARRLPENILCNGFPEGKGRDRTEVARAWIRQLATAIRAEDPDRLITVGLVDWSLPRPGLDSGFHPAAIAPELDFLSVHLYPESGKLDAALETLRAFAVGKPVVIEETFFLRCTRHEFDDFFRRSRAHAAGWIGFYWGRTPDECRRSKEIADALMLAWLEWFQKSKP
jgi:hypothetical protein